MPFQWPRGLPRIVVQHKAIGYCSAAVLGSLASVGQGPRPLTSARILVLDFSTVQAIAGHKVTHTCMWPTWPTPTVNPG
jgi:hypothetical protein